MNTSDEFKKFLSSDPVSPPAILYRHIRDRVSADLKPRSSWILLKVTLAHLITALTSLIFCPQFGVGPFGGEFGFFHFMMDWGWAACAAGCGVLFMSGTGLLSACFLNPDERRVFQQNSGWVFCTLAALSWAGFMFISKDSLLLVSHLVWATSATVSALLLFRSASTLELWIKQRSLQ